MSLYGHLVDKCSNRTIIAFQIFIYKNLICQLDRFKILLTSRMVYDHHDLYVICGLSN